MKTKYLLCLALAALTAAFRPALAEETEILRVGFFAFSGYHILEEDGRRSGYGYEFLQRLATHADWMYEYVGYDSSYADALDMLRSGEVDLVTSVSKTPEREEEFLFSDQDIGVNSTIMTVKAGNEAIIEGDYATYDGIRVGMLEGNSKNKNFERFAQEHDFTYQSVYFGTQDELTGALQSGTVDAAVTGSLRQLQNEWLLESFDANPFYLCVRKDRPDLMARIDQAIDEMDMNTPNWRSTLHDTYYATDLAGSIVLSADERAFLSQLQSAGQPLSVLLNPAWAPYTSFQDGRAVGVLPSIFETLAESLQLSFQYIPMETAEEYYALRAAGDADIVLDFADDHYQAEEEGYKITEPYFSTNYARLTKEGFSGPVRRIAVISINQGIRDYISSRYPSAALLEYTSPEACVQAVLTGKADACILYTYTASQFVQKDAQNRLESTVFGETSMTFAVNAHIPHALLSLLSKGVRSIDPADWDAIIAHEVDAGRSLDISLIAFLYRNPVYGVMITALVLLLLFTLAMLVVRLKNQKRLKTEVARATRELEDKTQQLSHALQAADAANRAKTSFLNNMSHDIRTPMNAIIGYTALASTHLDNRERAQDYLSKIAQASNHLLSLINDVLDMSRIEAGKITIEERPENLADILQGLRNIIQSDIHAKRLELFIDTVDVTDEEVLCDRLRLNQILLNLTSNAIKFTNAGGMVSIRVTQRPSDKPGCGRYEFRVSDTGIGMSAAFAKTVFEPFTREQTSTVSGIQGTGLGMAITKNIVDMMDGSITVESTPGKGTTFTVQLDLRLATEHHDIAAIAELSGFRGLVVDDDMVSCQSVCKMLRQIGLRAEWTLSGREAVARTSEAIELSDPFEVYIVDWAMPDMSGVETVRQIRQIVGTDSPIILMSAYDWSDIEAEARRAGVTGFISKPLFASDLHRTLERSLGHATEKEAEPAAPETRASFSGKRILLVEDNELNQEIAAELLSEAGFTVECAENGQIACDKVKAARPGYYDLVLMDIQMPIMDGYAATRAIRAMDGCADLPIVAMTANAFEEDRERALEAGMNGHLPKPIDVEKMMALLEKMLQKKK